MARMKVVTAPHILVFINGQVFGQVTSFRMSSSTPLKAHTGLDSLIPYELSNSAVKVVGSMGVLRTHSDGGLEGKGIVAPFQYLELERYFSILVIDRQTGSEVFRADHCKVTNQEWSVAARGRLDGSFSFEAIQWTNEAPYPT